METTARNALALGTIALGIAGTICFLLLQALHAAQGI